MMEFKGKKSVVIFYGIFFMMIGAFFGFLFYLAGHTLSNMALRIVGVLFGLGVIFQGFKWTLSERLPYVKISNDLLEICNHGDKIVKIPLSEIIEVFEGMDDRHIKTSKRNIHINHAFIFNSMEESELFYNHLKIVAERNMKNRNPDRKISRFGKP